MLWGQHGAMAALVEDCDRVDISPGMVCDANADGDQIVYLWIGYEHNASIARRYWPTVLVEADRLAR